MKTWTIYILRCEDGSLYTGITTDPDRRLQQHKAGTASAYTASFGAEEIVYTETVCGRSQASKREAAIKQLSRSEKQQLITGE